MKFLGLSLMIFVTGSLMSMQEGNKKQYFVLDGNYMKLLPRYEGTIGDRLALSESANNALQRGYNDADKYGAGEALFIKDNRQFVAKISLIRIQGVTHSIPNYLVKIKPWDKVKLFEDNQ